MEGELYGGLPFVAGRKVSPYLLSRLVSKTKKHRFWSIFDLDGTYAAGSLAARHKVRAWSEQRGALLFSTARTPELVMSPESFELSRNLAGFTRPMPWWSWGMGPLQQDPDAILAFGEGLYIAAAGCVEQGFAPYFVDSEYERNYLDPMLDGVYVDGQPWYQLALALVHRLGLQVYLSHMDRKSAYALLLSNVVPLKFRIQLDFFGLDAVEQKYRALDAVTRAISGTPLQGRLEGVDESNPSDDPQKNRATLYLMPPQARKEDMTNQGLIQTCRHAEVRTSDVRGIMAGDTLTDMFALCEGGLDADFAGILVGGSRLNKCLEEQSNFAGVDLRKLHSSLKRVPDTREGFYYYDNPVVRGAVLDPQAVRYKESPKRRRIIVIGAQAYPNTIGVETIWAYIEEHQKALAA
jgi:hypothetical protein